MLSACTISARGTSHSDGWTKASRNREKETVLGTFFDDEDVRVLDELSCSVIWCILEGVFICVVLIVCGCTDIVSNGGSDFASSRDHRLHAGLLVHMFRKS